MASSGFESLGENGSRHPNLMSELGDRPGSLDALPHCFSYSLNRIDCTFQHCVTSLS
jgi:hypothetical protein